METLVWTYLVMAVTVSSFITYRVVSWHYKRKIKKIYKKNNIIPPPKGIK